MEQIQDPTGAVGHLIDRIGAREIMRLYATPHFASAPEFLVMLAQQRGKLKKVLHCNLRLLRALRSA